MAELSGTQLTASEEEILAIVRADHFNPHAVLGLHETTLNKKKVRSIRAYVPAARELFVIPKGKNGRPIKMQRLHKDGFFETLVPLKPAKFAYRLRAAGYFDDEWEFDDAYAFPPLLTDFDLHLFAEGNFLQFYRKFGAQVLERDGVAGVNFAVWAPNAVRVSVIGNFNAWDGRRHPMRVHPGFGVWELFIPGLMAGDIYKYELKTKSGDLRIKTDPVAFRGELRPATASQVHQLGAYQWQDTGWMAERRDRNAHRSPISIYEVHLGSWRRKPEEQNRTLTYREIAPELAAYVREMGFTHVELLPVTEYPYDGSWGYQTTGYFAPTSRYGSPDDFKYFVDMLHQHGIGVILDWVPAHFPKDDSFLRRFDGTALYEHEDPRLGEHPDWGTLIFNYGRNEVRNFLVANALFWFDEYHVDGLRVDAVASMLYLDYSRKTGGWVANQYGGRENLEAIEFIKKLNAAVYAAFPDIMMIAEESTAWPAVSRPIYLGGLGFGYKWNMGWMNDFLKYMEKDPIHRKYHHNNLTFGLLYAFTENFILVLSHDEVVHGKRSLLSKMPGDAWQKFANLRLAFGFMFGHPGKKLLFMGGEFGQWREWDYSQSIDWHLLEYAPHRQLQRYLKDLNSLYHKNPAFWSRDYEPGGFEWIDFQDTDNCIVSFLRRGEEDGEFLVFVFNFTPVPRRGYRIGVPQGGYYSELLNSDSEMYGGSNLGNFGGVAAQDLPWHGHQHSIEINLPPLGALIFQPYRERPKPEQTAAGAAEAAGKGKRVLKAKK